MKFIDLRMPTDDELRVSSERWAEAVSPCFIDHWPRELMALSAPTDFVVLPQDCTALFDETRERGSFKKFAAPIANEIDCITGFDRKFFRLNSRSPKDAPWPFELPVSCSGKEMLSVMAASERMLDDLCYFSHSTVPPKLCLREFWPGVRAELEFRCFIKDRRILAVAEYLNRHQDHQWVVPAKEDDASLRSQIDDYLTNTVIPRLHIDTVVVDLCRLKEWRLLEINPYGLSDPVGAESYAAIENTVPFIARLPRQASGAVDAAKGETDG